MVNKTRVANIPAHLPFLDTLVGWMRAHYGERLPDVALFLPSRQAVELARQRFAASCDTACRLPLLLPLMDMDEQATADVAPDAESWRQMLSQLPPAMHPTQRKSLLIRLVNAYYRRQTRELPPLDQMTQLSEALARLLDEMQQQQVSWQRLKEIVPDRLSLYWQQTVTFLEILSTHWPGVLAEQGRMDVWQRRNHMLGALARQWEQQGLSRPVIIAGSTGSIPSTAGLMRALIGQEDGLLVLPGLDIAVFGHAEELPVSHPQAGLHRLLARLGCEPADVMPLDEAPPPPRSGLLRHLFGDAATLVEKNATLLHRHDCASPDEEAHLAAMLALETAGQGGRCVIACEQPELKRRVAVLLRSAGIEPYRVGGSEIARGELLTFLRLLLQAADAQFAPVPLLGLLRHKLARFGYTQEALHDAVSLLEITVLRGLRPAAGLQGLHEAIWKRVEDEEKRAQLLELHARLQSCFDPWAVPPSAAQVMEFDAVLQQHIAIAEQAASTPDIPGHSLLWQGEEGRLAAATLLDLRRARLDIGLHSLPEYEALLRSFFTASCPDGSAASPVWLASPRDVRLVQADRMVLCGLNEGCWPPEHRGDPWMSQPMRASVSLPLAGETVGQAAHDFWMLAHAPETILLRSEREGGAPTVPARWLSQLESLGQSSPELSASLRQHGQRWSGWLAALHRVPEVPSYPRPDPVPPGHAKPSFLSVSKLEQLIHDRYRFYTESILGLRELDALDQPLDRADFGNLLHAVLERFVKAHPSELPLDARETLLAHLDEVAAELLDQPLMASFWRPRLLRLLDWFLEQEREHRQLLSRVEGEQKVQLHHESGVTLRGRIDRLEHGKDGHRHVIDYKTGGIPSKKQVEDGLRPQLPALALLLARQRSIQAATVASLAYWKFSGGDEGGEICTITEGEEVTAQLMQTTETAIDALLQNYLSERASFRAEPGGRYGDDDIMHFSRWKEWSA